MATSSSVSSISGLASGIQWQDMIDQIIELEKARQLTPVSDRITSTRARSTAWSNYRSTIAGVRDAAKALADSTAFDKFTTSAGSTASGYSVISATAAAGATPGTYRAEVLATATAEKLGGSVVSDVDAALGLSGTVLVAGRAVTVEATDTLATVRDKINAVNTGATASHVGASILTVSSGASRLVLTNELTGAAGIELTENGGSSVLSGLGLVSASLTANTTSSGATRSYALASSTQTLAQSLGITMPTASTFKVDGHSVSVDLSQDTLASIVSKINTATGASTASLSSETVNGSTVYRVLVAGSVTVDAGDAANSTRNLQQLGFLRNARTGEAQVLRLSGAMTDTTTALPATAASRLVDVGALAGDTLSFTGTKTDGTAVTVAVPVDGTTTLQDVLDALSSTSAGFGTAARGVTAAIDAQGRITLTDGSVGESKVTLSATNDGGGGGTLSLGSASVVTAGRAMQLAAASDAQIRLDGILITRSSNTISDAIGGVTLSVSRAEVGSPVNVTIARDNDAVVTAVRSLVTAYNAAVRYVNTQTAASGSLPLDSSIRGTLAGIKSALLGNVTGLANTTYTTAALVGLTLDRNGQLTLDESMLKSALALKPDEVKALFRSTGTSPSSAVQFMAASSSTLPGTYNLAITQAATVPSATGSAITTYGNASVANQMLVTDSFTGRTTTVALTDGDTASSIVSKLNTAFGAEGLRLAAAVSGSAVQISGLNYGSASTFTVSFKLNGVAAAQQLGFGAAAVAGLDVAGTINGKSATGVGQLLTANAPGDGETNDAQGLAILYTGTGAATTTVSHVRGVGGGIRNALDPMLTAGSGMIDQTTDSYQRTIDSLTSRQTTIQARLDRQRESLAARFTAMEAAMSRLQSQSTWLSGQINSLNGLNSSR